MKHFFITFLLLITGFTTINAQENHTLTINFTGMKSDKGALFIGLHNKKEDFLKKHYKEAVIKITNKKAVFVFKGLPKGEYAVSVFHDENNNKKMDTNFIGIPIEPIGVSNDAKGFMGPPKYKNAKFIIVKNINLTISVN